MATLVTMPFDYIDTYLNIFLDGGGSVITTGIKGGVQLPPWNGQILSWRILPDQTGTIAFDLWKSNFAGWPPSASASITGSAKPTLTNAARAESSTLTGWTTTFSAHDILRVNVETSPAPATVTRALLALRIRKT